MLLNNSILLIEAKEVSEEKARITVLTSIIISRQQSSNRQKRLNSSMQNATLKKQNRNKYLSRRTSARKQREMPGLKLHDSQNDIIHAPKMSEQKYLSSSLRQHF